MNTASIVYLANYSRTPKPHARDGVRTARVWNATTHRLCDEVLQAELAAHLETELAGLFPDRAQADRVRESM